MRRDAFKANGPSYFPVGECRALELDSFQLKWKEKIVAPERHGPRYA